MTTLLVADDGKVSCKTLTGESPGATRHAWISWRNLNELQRAVYPVFGPCTPRFPSFMKDEENGRRLRVREQIQGYLRKEQDDFFKTIFGVLGFDTVVLGRAWRRRAAGDPAHEDEVCERARGGWRASEREGE